MNNAIQQFDPPTSKTASLRQAIEWIVYGLKPLTPQFDAALRDPDLIAPFSVRTHEERIKIKEAQQLLFIALSQGHIIPNKARQDLVDPDHSDGSGEIYKSIPIIASNWSHDERELSPEDFHYPDISWHDNLIICRMLINERELWLAVSNVTVDFADLQKLFPQPLIKPSKEMPLISEKKITTSNEKVLGTRERETLLKIVIGMAVGGYGYSLERSKSEIPRQISDDLNKIGLSVTDETIRKYLNQALELIPRD